MRISYRFVFSSAIFFLSATTLWAQTAGSGSGSISGRLTMDGKPLAGVPIAVSLNDHPDEIGGVRPGKVISKVVSDDQGAYQVEGLPAAGYKVLPCNPAYVVTTQDTTYGPGKYVSVADGESVANIDFSLARAAVISGRVTLADGRPAVDAQVWLTGAERNRMFYDPATGELRQSVQTDDNGAFRIYGLAADKYNIEVSVFSISTKPFFYPGVADQKSAGVVTVASGEDFSTADVKIGASQNQGYLAAGKIVDENGKAVANVRFIIYPASETGRRTPGVPYTDVGYSNPSGEFSARNLSAGKYAVVVVPDDRSSYCTDPVTFDAESGEAARLRLRAHVGAGISGTAVIEGTSDPGVLSQMSKLSFFVSASNDDVFSSRSMNISANGSFEAVGFVSGHLRMNLALDKELENFSILRIERDGAPLKEDKLEIKDQEHITDLRIVIAYGTGVIRGEVAGLDGTAIPDRTKVYVSARLTSGESPILQRSTVVDARGHFEIEGLPDGDYTISATYSAKGRRPKPQKQTVTVAGGQAPEMKLAVDFKGQTAAQAQQ